MLQYALGVGPYVKWGSSASPLTRAVSSAAGSDPFAVTAFNASYTDSGLFGFVASSPRNVAGLVRLIFYSVMSLQNPLVTSFCILEVSRRLLSWLFMYFIFSFVVAPWICNSMCISTVPSDYFFNHPCFCDPRNWCRTIEKLKG